MTHDIDLPFFEDLVKWISILRLILWLLQLLKRLIRPKPKKAPQIYSAAQNEFGYIDFNGAY